MKFRRLLICGALATCLVPGYAFAEECIINIGGVGPLTGGAAEWGLGIVGAADFVAAEVNKAGGLKIGNQTCKWHVIKVDTKYTTEGGAAAANSLASQGVRYIIGPIGSPEVTGMKPIAARNDMLMLSDSYAQDAIGPKWPLTFHVTPGPNVWGSPIVKLAKEAFGIKKVALIAPNDQAGTDTVGTDVKAYKQNGVAVVATEYYQRGTSNFQPIVQRLLSSGADTIDTASTPPGDAGVVVKQLRQAGFTGPIGRLGGPGTEQIARIAGGYGVLRNFYWYETVAIDDQLRKMDAEYKELLGKDRPQNNYFYLFSAAGRMLAKAMVKAGTWTDVKAVAAALKELPVDDPNVGKGHWIGQSFYGINNEISLPFGIGFVKDGKRQEMIKEAAPSEK